MWIDCSVTWYLTEKPLFWPTISVEGHQPEYISIHSPQTISCCWRSLSPRSPSPQTWWATGRGRGSWASLGLQALPLYQFAYHVCEATKKMGRGRRMTELEADSRINTSSKTDRQKGGWRLLAVRCCLLGATSLWKQKPMSYRLPEGSSEWVNWWMGGVKSKRMVSVFARQKPLDFSTSAV